MTTSNPVIDAERRQALRALLRQPLLPAAGESDEDYKLVRRHVEWLKAWFDRFPSWSLHIDREAARLRKPPAAFPSGRHTAFTRRRYALLCLTLAVIEQSGSQTTLSHIAQMIQDFIGTDADLQSDGLVFDAGNHDHRRDLVHGVRFLIEHGVLNRLDGDEQRFLNREESSDVLYDINRRILTLVLQLPQNPSAIEAMRKSGPAELGDEPSTRARLVRALLDDPILYFHHLNDEERQYLEKHRTHLLRQITEATGLIADVRNEGIAMIDDVGELAASGRFHEE